MILMSGSNKYKRKKQKGAWLKWLAKALQFLGNYYNNKRKRNGRS